MLEAKLRGFLIEAQESAAVPEVSNP
jgi:hypothetical protein